MTLEDWEAKSSTCSIDNNSTSNRINDVRRGTLIAEGEVNEDISVITESATVNLLSVQAEIYDSDEKEELKVDTLKTIQTYLKKIFRQAKFLSDTGNSFKRPNFVITNGLKSQSVEICEYLWKSLGKRMTIMIYG